MSHVCFVVFSVHFLLIFIKFIATYIFGAIINEIVFLILFLDCLLLIYRNIIGGKKKKKSYANVCSHFLRVEILR